MKIAIGCDHGGFVLKGAILAYLDGKGIDYVDYGCFDESSVDYPDYAAKVARAVQKGEVDKGILMCGTGIGITIAANKFDGIRAAVVTNEFCARATAQHNDSNILGLGGRVVSPVEAVHLVDVWLSTPYEGGRHQKRLDKITELEKQNKQ